MDNEVIFIGASDEQAAFGNYDDPRQHLFVGQSYKLVGVKESGWHTGYTLEKFAGLRFNSVCFDWSQE